MGRRIRVGGVLAARMVPTPVVTFTDPPPPYERFAGRLEGRELSRQRDVLGLTVADFGMDCPPDDGPDSWDSEELVYQATFATADAALVMPRHAGAPSIGTRLTPARFRRKVGCRLLEKSLAPHFRLSSSTPARPTTDDGPSKMPP
jgi:hypothetical protein